MARKAAGHHAHHKHHAHHMDKVEHHMKKAEHHRKEAEKAHGHVMKAVHDGGRSGPAGKRTATRKVTSPKYSGAIKSHPKY